METGEGLKGNEPGINTICISNFYLVTKGLFILDINYFSILYPYSPKRG